MPYFEFEGISLGFIAMHTWGFFVALGFLTGFVFLLKGAERKSLADSNTISGGFVCIVIGGMLFAGIGGGFASLGGILGGLTAAVMYSIYKKISPSLFLGLADLAASGIVLGLAIGRIGCFLINDHLGTLTSLPWGIIWPDGSARHPVALYLIINALVIFLILELIKNKFKKPGRLFLFFLTIYSFSRFFLDFTREERGTFYHLSFGGLFLICLIIFFYLRLKEQPQYF